MNIKLTFEVELSVIILPEKDLYTIGRMPYTGQAPGNDILLPIDDRRISRYQCYIRKGINNQYFIYDGCPNDPAYGELAGKPSAFGTFINGKKTTTNEGIPISDGDVIEFLPEAGQCPRYRLRINFVEQEKNNIKK